MISIITVNYNSKSYLEKLISSVEKYYNNKNIELIIVNNDNVPIEITNKEIEIKVIQQGKNIGFGAANNIGVQKASGEWLLFVNPDLEFVDNSLTKGINFIKKNKDVSIIGPKIIQSSRKSPQPWTCGKKSSLWQIIFRNTIKKPWNKKSATSVDWVSGTALLISRKDFLEIGGFDEAFFMYFEDQDLCLRVKQDNKKIFFYPDFQVLHHDGKSWENKHAQKTHYYESQDIFFQKHQDWLTQKILKLIKNILKGR